MQIVVQINDERFVMKDAAALGELRSDIEAAARSGGAFVRIGGLENAPEILVTPTTKVRVDTVPPGDAELMERPTDEAQYDFDSY